MGFFKFLISKTFLKQLAIAIAVVALSCFLLLKWLKVYTNHGDFKTVPDLTGKSLEVAEIELNQHDLVLQIQDSVNFNPDYPPYSVIDQDPNSGEKVKENRKIYLTLNPSGYRKILVPDLAENTYRQAKPTLEALGFKVGKVIYRDNIAKDMVLGLRYNDKPLEPGAKLPKTTAIDVVLGNGNRAN